MSIFTSQLLRKFLIPNEYCCRILKINERVKLQVYNLVIEIIKCYFTRLNILDDLIRYGEKFSRMEDMERFTTIFFGPSLLVLCRICSEVEYKHTAQFFNTYISRLYVYVLRFWKGGVPQIFGHQVVKHLPQVTHLSGLKKETRMGAIKKLNCAGNCLTRKAKGNAKLMSFFCCFLKSRFRTLLHVFMAWKMI